MGYLRKAVLRVCGISWVSLLACIFLVAWMCLLWEKMLCLQEISRNLIVFEQHAVDICTYLLTINDQINRSTKQFHILNLHIFFFFSGPFNGEAATEKKRTTSEYWTILFMGGIICWRREVGWWQGRKEEVGCLPFVHPTQIGANKIILGNVSVPEINSF